MEADKRVNMYVRLSWAMSAFCIIGWPTTHILMIITKPAGSNWVFHLLLALSWLALLYAVVGVIVTAEIRKVQHKQEDSSG